MFKLPSDSSKQRPPTEAETESFIFGAGIPATWSWWHRRVQNFRYDDDGCAPEGWNWVVTSRHPDGGAVGTAKVVRHADILAAAEVIVGDDKFRPSLRTECWNLLFDPDDCDIDAGAADAILQVVIYGEVLFG